MTKNKYVKLSQIDHILLRPDTYIGSVNTEKKEMFVIDDITLQKDMKIVKKEINYNPGFLKIFDEILCNASDASIRTGKVKNIKINIDNEKVSIENDGPSIAVELHSAEKVYNSELIFNHLLTGENYDDTEQRYVSGKNGYGAKLCNVFSKKFIVDNCDGKKKFKQITKDNMKKIGEPIVKDVDKNTKPYTKIIYYPDVEKFGLDKIDDDSISLMIKRCLDIAVYNPKVRVVVNGKTIPVKNVKDYMKMHLSDNTQFFYEKLNNGWEVGIAKCDNEQFENVSVVNGINTYRGGTHVSYISNQLAKDIVDKFKKNINITWSDIKNKLFIFLVCQIPNPQFDTQTKENLTNYISKEISNGEYVSESTVKKIMKSEIVESILDEIEAKELAKLKKLRKNKSKEKIENLVDANSKDRKNCELYIFEGQSASGDFRLCRDPQKQGFFCLKGKFINTKSMSDKKIAENKEAFALMNAIGLTFDKKDQSELRYSKIILASDADVDGDSIIGLLISFFSRWAFLFNNIIFRCMTPLLVLKAKDNSKKNITFYTINEYKEWEKNNDTEKYYYDYKKGLGSLNSEEFKELVNNPKLMKINLTKQCINEIDIWFGNNSEKRKEKLLK